MNKKNIVIWVFVIVMSGLLIWFGIYAMNATKEDEKNNNAMNANKEEENNKPQNKEELNKKEEKKETEKTGEKTASSKTSQTVLEKLYELGVVDSKNIEDVELKDIDYTIEYGLMNNHDVKIKIYFDKTGKIYDESEEHKQIIDVYVDDQKYNLLDTLVLSRGPYLDRPGGLLLKYLTVNYNDCGILIINNIENRMSKLPVKPFILLFNQNNEFEVIDKITTQYSNPNSLYFDANKSPIEVTDKYVSYCKYINNHKHPENEWGNGGNGLVDVSCIKYNGTTEEVYKEVNDVSIQEQVS